MNLHLNYDGKQNNGIIFNATYSGAMFIGVEFRPSLSFEYESFMYSEVFDGQPDYVIQNDGIRRLMTEVEAEEVLALAVDWVQPLGQEGNPTQAQINERRASEIKEELKRLDLESIRPLRAVANGTQTEIDTEKLIALDAERQVLADELGALNV